MYLLFDIGGTKTRIAISRDGQTFEEPRIYPTPQNYEEGIERFVHTSQALAGVNKVQYIVGGVAGPLIKNGSSFNNIANLPNWAGKPIKVDLENLLGCPVEIKNDSALIGLGEVSQRKEKYKIAVYITISTGIGGTRIVDNKIDVSTFGFEPGYQIVNFEENKQGQITDFTCWGELGSGKAIEKKYGFKPEEIVENKVWEETAEYAAIGLVNTILFWSPEIIILGGALMKSLELDRIQHYLKKYMEIFQELPKLEKAKLGDVGGLYGALEIIKQKNL